MSEQQIIIAVSGNGGEKPHIEAGLRQAKLLDASVRIVHVVRMLLVPAGYAVGDVTAFEAKANDPCSHVDGLRAYVEQVLERPLEPGEAAFTAIRGDDVEELIELSGTCTMLVLGHHHINGFLHIFTHTVDERIINRARCPVLIVPEGG